MPTLYSLRRTVQDGRTTVRGWTHYRHQTGSLPWFSIAIHCLNWALVISGSVFLIVRSDRYQLSRWEFLGVLLLVGVPYSIFWFWLKDKVKVKQIRDGKRLANLRQPR